MKKDTKQLNTPKRNAKIWRYLDISKFISLINDKALSFTRVDVLNDPFEGSYSKPSINAREDIYSSIPKEKQEHLYDAFKKFREFTFVNCWHIDKYESAAMWKLYLKSNEGIAIQSTYDRLDKSFTDESMKIALGKVNYIDYNHDDMNLDNPLFAFFYKRKSFDYENELRAAFTQIPAESGGFMNLADLNDQELDNEFNIYKPLNNKIMKINIDLNILIENIYVSPTAEDWFMDVIKSLVDKYSLDKVVKKSDLRNDPIF